MARLQDRHPAGAPGPWFVDTRCFDCDAARHVAPGLIGRNPVDGVSYFLRQPTTPEELLMAWRAVEVCPTRSVGHVEQRRPPERVFPHDLGDGVHRLGHNAKSSFGAHSYLVARDGANVMVDAPRWTDTVSSPLRSPRTEARVRGAIDRTDGGPARPCRQRTSRPPQRRRVRPLPGGRVALTVP